MEFWFLLLLGLVTYLMVQRTVAAITRTPIWLLWLVLMTPAVIWTVWTAMYGAAQTLPRALVIWPLILCPILYWVLLQWGRRDATPPASAQTEPQAP